MTETFSQAQISVLEYPENVRTRKEMYIRDQAHMAYEIIDNAVDEHSAGYCNTIATIITNDYVQVVDDGRGIPVTEHKDKKYAGKSQLEVAMSVLHAGGKFGGKEGSYATVSGGLHGVGASCVNALSSEFVAQVRTSGNEYAIGFAKGIKALDLTIQRALNEGEQTGTTITYTPDKEIWGDEVMDYEAVIKRVKQIAYLNPGLTMYIKVDTDNFKEEHTFTFEDGVKGYVSDLVAGKELLTDDIPSLSFEHERQKANIAFTYKKSHSTTVLSFVNNVVTPGGGDHLTGFNEAISKAIKQYAEENKLVKDPKMITSNDTQEGLTAIVSYYEPEPKFEGQGKEKIKSITGRRIVREKVTEFFLDYLAQDKDRASKIVEHAIVAAKAREAAKKARETALGAKDLHSNNTLPGKLTDCSSRKSEECEIFYVEGDSAAGTAKQARDRVIQAIMPVFGKILNVEKKEMKDVISNAKLKEIIQSLGCGIGPTFDIKKLRYHKAIIMADGDVDGSHIQTLYAVFFYRYLPELIEGGHVYFAMPPLFLAKKGKEKHYFYTKEELDAFDTEGYTVQRFKGLGEMNADQLEETTMKKGMRRLQRLTITSAEAANAAFELCMGEEVAPRREFIMNNLNVADVAI